MSNDKPSPRLGWLAERLVHLHPRRMNRELLDGIIVMLRDGEKAILDLHQEIRVLELSVADAHPEEPQDEARRLAADLLNFVLGDLEWVRAQGGRHSVCPLCHCVCERDGGPGHADDCPSIELARRFDTLYPPVRAALPGAEAEWHRKRRKPMTNRKERGCWLWPRCYNCGHRLRFDSTGCPQCSEEFDGRKPPKRFPEKCDCDRCRDARNPSPQPADVSAPAQEPEPKV